ncbi:hypothetical protein GY12_11285 [Micrococcus luteus]|nr:hypothetical protein GY12_11285 [Micrococcus luteus]
MQAETGQHHDGVGLLVADGVPDGGDQRLGGRGDALLAAGEADGGRDLQPDLGRGVAAQPVQGERVATRTTRWPVGSGWLATAMRMSSMASCVWASSTPVWSSIESTVPSGGLGGAGLVARGAGSAR